jgi:hypothetical protein
LAEFVEMVAATDQSYTLELALSSYRANIVSGLWLTVIAAPCVDRTEFNADVIVAVVTRNAAAVTELGALRVLAERN